MRTCEECLRQFPQRVQWRKKICANEERRHWKLMRAEKKKFTGGDSGNEDEAGEEEVLEQCLMPGDK